MMKVASTYKGVILLFIVLVVMANMWSNRVKELNAMNDNNTVAYYEK